MREASISFRNLRVIVEQVKIEKWQKKKNVNGKLFEQFSIFYFFKLSRGVKFYVESRFRKLDAVNFALDDTLIVGLAKTAYDEVPDEYRCAISEPNWNEWANNWKKKHSEFKNW